MSRSSRAPLIIVLAALGLGGAGTASPRPADDAVAPSIAVSSAKLRRPAGGYSLRLALVIRDDVDGNPVGYTVVVKRGAVELAHKAGTTASRTILLTLRLRPLGARVRSIRVVVTAIDPAGNRASLARTVTVPR